MARYSTLNSSVAVLSGPRMVTEFWWKAKSHSPCPKPLWASTPRKMRSWSSGGTMCPHVALQAAAMEPACASTQVSDFVSHVYCFCGTLQFMHASTWAAHPASVSFLHAAHVGAFGFVRSHLYFFCGGALLFEHASFCGKQLISP